MKRLLILLCLLPCMLFAQSPTELNIDLSAKTASAIRYWFDTETDYSTLSSTNGHYEFDVSALKSGIHTLHCQVVNDDNTLSYIRSAMFLKHFTHPNEIANTKLRYWFDNEASQTKTLSLSTTQIDVSDLQSGIHTLHCQIINTDGSLSFISSAMFLKPYTHPDEVSNATLRYWIDEDTTIYTTTADVSLIRVPNLGVGTHTLHTQIVHADGSLGFIRSEDYEQTIEEFEPWEPEHPENPGNYALTLHINDSTMGSVSGSGLYAQNTKVEITATPATGHYFVKWSDDDTTSTRSIVITQDLELTAIFEPYTYKVQFLNFDGTVLQSDMLAYGSTPVYSGSVPTKPANAQYTYNFKGWTPDIASVIGAIDYTAEFDSIVNKYQVKFIDYDGTIIKTDSLEYDAMPQCNYQVKPATAQYTYSFKGWQPEVVSVTADATYTAEIDSVVNEYQVRFLNFDGTVLQSDMLAYGSTPVYSGTEPTKPANAQYAYNFKGWTPDIVSVSATADYVADFDSTLIALDTVHVYDTQNITDLSVGQITHIIVHEDGYLNVSVPTSAKSLTLYMSDKSAQVENIQNLNVENAVMVMRLSANTDVTSRWFAFAVPFEVSLSDGVFKADNSTAAVNGIDFVIDEYNGALRASTQNGWQRVSTETLVAGRMYMIAASSDVREWRFAAAHPSALTSQSSIPVSAYPSTFGNHHAGWNGIANATLVDAFASMSGLEYATLYNNEHSVYEVVRLNKRELRANEPLFVQVPTTGNVIFATANAGSQNMPMRMNLAESNNAYTLELSGEQSDFTDRAYMTLSEDKDNNYTIGRDLQKMETSASTVPQLWLEAYNMHLSAYDVLLQDNSAYVAIGLYAPAASLYVLNMQQVPSDVEISLVHNGQTIADLTKGATEIFLEQGYNEGYGITIRRAPEIVTDIFEAESQSDHLSVKKTIINGHLYIATPDGRIYNAVGQTLHK